MLRTSEPVFAGIGAAGLVIVETGDIVWRLHHWVLLVSFLIGYGYLEERT